MKRRVVLLGLAVSACASPEPAYYTLAAVPGVARGGAPASVELRRPGIAGYLDRPEIVRAGSAYRLRVATGERWGEPFGDLFGRILAEDLNTRLPQTSVFTAAGAISAQSDAAVELDVQRFDLDANGTVVLLAQVAVSRVRRGAATTRVIRLTQRPTSPATSDLVAAMSAALGALADGIADMLRHA